MDKCWDTIIFDLDGTLLNSLDDIWNSVNNVMVQMGFPEKAEEEVKMTIGNGVNHLMKSCFSPQQIKEHPEMLEQAVRMFKEHYFLNSNQKTVPYDGAKECLWSLSKYGLKTAIVSNKPDEVAQKVVRHFFGDSVTYISGEKEGINRKPAPDAILNAMKILGSSCSGSVYVGDSEVDALTASNAGIPVILVTWGYRDRDVLQALNPDYLVESFEELQSLLMK